MIIFTYGETHTRKLKNLKPKVLNRSADVSTKGDFTLDLLIFYKRGPMSRQVIRWLVLWPVLFFSFWQGSLSIAQAPDGTNNLFSTWIKLALMGHSQSEIESALSHISNQKVSKVKHLIRLNVIKNLKNMNLEDDIRLSTHPQDLMVVQDKIQTEIRFAGLENDRHLRHMIQNYFGISMIRI